MSQPDFEKQFQERLKDRELEPSEGSWEKLQERLNGKTKSTRPFFWWSGLAASIVGGILIMSLVFQNSENTDPPAFVDAPSEEIDAEIKETPVVVESKRQENSKEHMEPESIATQDLHDFGSNKNQPEVASTGTKRKKEGFFPEVAHDSTEEALGHNDENSSTVEVESLSNVTDTEIEALLAEAMEELDKDQSISAEFSEDDMETLIAAATERLNSEYPAVGTEVSVADNLLQEVERELEHSFREKVFEVLKESFEKTRTAVANRNN